MLVQLIVEKRRIHMERMEANNKIKISFYRKGEWIYGLIGKA
ncbi:hypothetical protein bthur0001_22520 [Bacillus thuringiensis serovar tochigiensis BGSC 4Y1]|nr:hypothetical protein bthur0001_22520 [Bacillus thuringiensis serovar tochigiensis BGSC 4Y1]